MRSAHERALLLERTGERIAIEQLLTNAATGRGGMIVVEGPAGIGKTRLLDAATGWANERGFLIGRAVGGALEHDFSFGAVRQLFEPLVARSSDPDRLFTGAAAVAARLCGRTTTADADDARSPGAVLHGLYWLTASLADVPRPLILICDDAHWLDGPSLRFLAYLTNRVVELPVAVVVGTRPPEPGRPESEVLARLLTHDGVTRLRPAPLTADAVGSLVRHSLDEAADAFCDAVARASRGNPFLVTEVVRAVVDAGLSPDASSASQLSVVAVDANVLARIGHLPTAALEVARATAVLGSDAHLRHVAALADLDIDDAGVAADLLLRADVLGPERPLRFVHPLVRAAVYQDLLPGDRSTRHRRAAALLRAEGAPVDRVAVHHMATEPAGDPAVVEVLEASARGALVQGATEVAIAQLRRALAEPPPADRRLGITLGLGSAESFLLDPAAIDHLGEAVDGIEDTSVRIMLATARAVSLCVDGRPHEAVASLRALETEAGDPPHRLALLAGLNFVGATGPVAAPLVGDEIAELLTQIGPDTSAPPGVLGVRAYVGACSGDDVETVITLALRALGSVDDRDPMLPMWFHLPVAALIMADRDRDAATIIEHRLTAARRSGAPGQMSIALFLRAMVALRAGDLDDAETDARAALDLCQQHHIAYVLPGPLAIVVDVLRERDDLDGAESALSEHGYQTGDGDSLFHLFLLAARARLRGAHERFDEAIADLERGWVRSLATGIRSPNLIAWRSNLSFARALSKQHASAIDQAVLAVHEANRFGSHRSRAEARRALAMSGAPDGEELATAATATFGRLGARLEMSRTQLVWAQSRGMEGTPAAIEATVEGLRLAESCGATRLAHIARNMLRDAGVTRRARPVSGVGALTAGERRVATLAAGGRTNREVAQELFITVKTVETHLARTFQKLEISSRVDLAEALSA